jgi:hypothetical protein
VGPDEDAMLTLGEVHTGLLQHSSALPAEREAQAVALVYGERVRRSERPIAYAVSPDVLTGVDCASATRSGRRTRLVGTAVSRACLTGGHIVQGSTFLNVMRSDTGRRLPWSHYLSKPGVVETIGRADPDDLIRGFLVPETPVGTLDLGAMSGRAMDQVQQRARLDRKPPFKMWRTRLRWAAQVAAGDGAEPRVRFTVEEGHVRTVAITVAADSVGYVVELCEDLARHDWLLTALLQVVGRSHIGALPRGEVVRRLAPAVDHLLHLWMPAARVDRSLLGVWESIERRPGFTRQWRASVARVRDQVAVSTAALYNAVAELNTRSA